VQALADELGVKVRIAIVEGDDVQPLAAAMRAAGTVEMFSGEPMPERLVTANAYLGRSRSRGRSTPARTSSSPAAVSTARSRSAC
jgi:hypothetical protein